MLRGCPTVPNLLVGTSFIAQTFRWLLVLLIVDELIAVVASIVHLLLRLLVARSLLEVRLLIVLSIAESSLRWLGLCVVTTIAG